MLPLAYTKTPQEATDDIFEAIRLLTSSRLTHCIRICAKILQPSSIQRKSATVKQKTALLLILAVAHENLQLVNHFHQSARRTVEKYFSITPAKENEPNNPQRSHSDEEKQWIEGFHRVLDLSDAYAKELERLLQASPIKLPLQSTLLNDYREQVASNIETWFEKPQNSSSLAKQYARSDDNSVRASDWPQNKSTSAPYKAKKPLRTFLDSSRGLKDASPSIAKLKSASDTSVAKFDPGSLEGIDALGINMSLPKVSSAIESSDETNDFQSNLKLSKSSHRINPSIQSNKASSQGWSLQGHSIPSKVDHSLADWWNTSREEALVFETQAALDSSEELSEEKPKVKSDSLPESIDKQPKPLPDVPTETLDKSDKSDDEVLEPWLMESGIWKVI